MDKRTRAALFRDRLVSAMTAAGLSQSALARRVGADRSTVSQLVQQTLPRLPNGHLVAELARALGVSSDWLLGLTERPEGMAELLASALAVSPAERTALDAQILGWHEEARGYKIRHVPATMPDLLETPEMLTWEHGALGQAAEEASLAQARLDWMRRSGSDYEIALPVQELQAMALGEGYYRGAPVAVRRGQIDWMLELHSQLFPRLRVVLFDARRVFSAPLTVYGPLQAVIYLGRSYLAFRDTERVNVISDHFDWLVRHAHVSDRDLPEHLSALRAQIT